VTLVRHAFSLETPDGQPQSTMRRREPARPITANASEALAGDPMTHTANSGRYPRLCILRGWGAAVGG
jgi:hypothetical protein